MASKFSEFLSKAEIDPRRILVASRQIERLRPADRHLRLERKRLRKSEDAAAKEKLAALDKPRSGRPVTRRLLAAAEEGKPITGAAKQRLVRAVNRVLSQKKKKESDLRSLF